MTVKNYSFIGAGLFHIRKKGAAEGFRDTGNVSQVEVSAQEDEKTLQNYRGGGGNYDSNRQVSSVTAQFTFTDFSPENFELATRGTITSVAAGTVTSEEHTVYAGAMTPLDFVPDFSDAANTVTVTIDPSGAATPAVQGTDYELTTVGIKPITGGGISDGDTIGVDYTKLASAIVSALMTSSQEYEGYLEGVNDAKSGSPVAPHFKRMKFGVPQNIAFIGSDYGSLQVTADILYDSAAASGTSPFFDVNMATL